MVVPGSKQEVTLIEERLSIFDNEDNSKEKFVYVIENIQDNQGIIVKKKIKIGNIINNRIEVISGLTKNEKIVTAGVNRIVEGQKVKLYEEGK